MENPDAQKIPCIKMFLEPSRKTNVVRIRQKILRFFVKIIGKKHIRVNERATTKERRIMLLVRAITVKLPEYLPLYPSNQHLRLLIPIEDPQAQSSPERGINEIKIASNENRIVAKIR